VGYLCILNSKFVFFPVYFETRVINGVTVFFLYVEFDVGVLFIKFGSCFLYVGLFLIINY
jgi:hypothetical protein